MDRASCELSPETFVHEQKLSHASLGGFDHDDAFRVSHLLQEFASSTYFKQACHDRS
jgi:hypothetical protein